MKSRATLLVTLALTAPLSVFAHHSFVAFDMAKNIVIEGTVQSYKLENPHAHITVQVASVDGKVVTPRAWDVEGAAANIMRRQGWSSDSLKVGDKVRLVGHPLRSGDSGLSLFYVIRPDGTRLYQDIGRPEAGSNLP